MSEMIERMAERLWDEFRQSIVNESVWPDTRWCDVVAYARQSEVSAKRVDTFRKAACAVFEELRNLGDEPGENYTQGFYSRRNIEALIEDALVSEQA
jgi:hypothetical protein